MLITQSTAGPWYQPKIANITTKEGATFWCYNPLGYKGNRDYVYGIHKTAERSLYLDSRYQAT